MHVLVVEDSRTQAARLMAILEEGGHQATGFQTLGAAIEWCQRQGLSGEGAVDVVLLDLNLPDADGLETVERMRSACAELPIVILTALGDTEVALAALRRGAQDYLVKGQHDLALLDRVMHYAVERQRISGELARLSDELRAKNEQLEHLNTVKNQFLGIAAHDLRSPLGVIVVYLQLLRRGDANLTDAQREMVRAIQRSTEFMWQLVNDLLDVSAIEAGRLELRRCRADARRLVESAVARHRLLAEAKQLTLELRYDAELPEAVRLDPPKIEQVLNNLLENAAKFSPSGARIEVELRRSGDDHICVSVYNPGQGIAPEHRGRLFQPFERGQKEGTAGEKSTGLGLAISRKIVEGHGGEIGVESQPGQGARFWFTLPIDLSSDDLP